MNVNDVIARVRGIAGDTNVLQFTDVQLLGWLNDGIRECATDNNLLQKNATQNLVVGTDSYDLPADILKLHSVKVDGEKIRVVTLDEFDNAGYGDATNSGLPSVAYVWAGKVVLFPKPDRIVPLTIQYIYDPVPVAAGDNLPLPVGYHVRLIDYCLAQVAQQDDDYPRYQLKMDEFRTGVSNLKDQPEWEYDAYPSITVSDRDAGGLY